VFQNHSVLGNPHPSAEDRFLALSLVQRANFEGQQRRRFDAFASRTGIRAIAILTNHSASTQSSFDLSANDDNALVVVPAFDAILDADGEAGRTGKRVRRDEVERRSVWLRDSRRRLAVAAEEDPVIEPRDMGSADLRRAPIFR
jgi:hypothetical protein